MNSSNPKSEVLRPEQLCLRISPEKLRATRAGKEKRILTQKVSENHGVITLRTEEFLQRRSQRSLFRTFLLGLGDVTISCVLSHSGHSLSHCSGDFLFQDADELSGSSGPTENVCYSGRKRHLEKSTVSRKPTDAPLKVFSPEPQVYQMALETQNLQIQARCGGTHL